MNFKNCLPYEGHPDDHPLLITPAEPQANKAATTIKT